MRFFFGIYKFALTPFVLRDWLKYRKLPGGREKRFSRTVFFPCVMDKTAATSFDRHYIYHIAWAMRKVREIAPAKHVDISSSLYFCSNLSAFIPVEFFDYRPPVLELPNLTCGKADLMKLDFPDDSISSLSCMHTIEHIGLGRYGDAIDPEGDRKALRELARVTAKGGNLLIVVPVGRPSIEFNAHRIYSIELIRNELPEFELIEFTLIPRDEADGGLLVNADSERVTRETYGCGCFHFVKKL
jgi:SAM-dependent methyltransferase